MLLGISPELIPISVFVLLFWVAVSPLDLILLFSHVVHSVCFFVHPRLAHVFSLLDHLVLVVSCLVHFDQTP